MFGSLGWQEIMMILIVALIIFGPRKLPEIGKTLGQSLAQFRKASEDFKRTWEAEVDLEHGRTDRSIWSSPAQPVEPYRAASVTPSTPSTQGSASPSTSSDSPSIPGTVAAYPPSSIASPPESGVKETKQDWL